ncbi:hemocyte protein-glutamine gamma-glutamyltransferase-like [Littorina saxatilis]|uniref:hemocyte protein-glutamine gamma-glutamyltransferase-like n=1 Tax=Littorina saxatilis TaxID=31220 RepID=UPI0038B673F4
MGRCGRRRGRFNLCHPRCRPRVPHHRHCGPPRRSPSPSPPPGADKGSPGGNRPCGGIVPRPPAPRRPMVGRPLLAFGRGRFRPFGNLFRGRRPLSFNFGGRCPVVDYGHVKPDDETTDEDEDEDEDENEDENEDEETEESMDEATDEDEEEEAEEKKKDKEAKPHANRPRKPKPGNKPKPLPADKNVLHVQRAEFMVGHNTTQHHTDEYDITEAKRRQLVVRRGQPFTVRIVFSRQYKKQKDDLRLVFEIGDDPKPSKGTHVEMILSDKDEEGEWGASIQKVNGKILIVKVFTPPTCFVGVWKFKVDVVKRKDENATVFRYNHKDPIYILFNPWCREDTVFLDSEEQREAYVLEDKGKLFVGNYKKISSRPWVFGQFSGNVLDCCMYLLDISDIAFSVRGDAIRVCRKLTALVNSQDEEGVLTGNWSGDYSGGKSPLSWTGSAPILEQYYKQKTSVEFGQCWVFSGVLTTILRALGIPARSVTNFASAHDADCSITIDIHYDDHGNPLSDMDEDSVWNFHVWNESWMARPDLPAGYGGWQALDSTPQETSDDVYCCGPCPVLAIKEGEVNLPYDGNFIFAEVNADKVYWMIQKDGTYKRIKVETHSVGKFISTCSLRGDREDVTKHYKYAENSSEERAAVLRANKVGVKDSKHDAYQGGPEDVQFELEFDANNTFVGSDFVVTLKCTNTSKKQRHLTGTLVANTMYYTGVVAELVGNNHFEDVAINPGKNKEITLSVSQEQYGKLLKDCCMMSVSVVARVNETDQVFTKKDDMRLRKPHLEIKAPDNGQVGQEVELMVSFVNPLTTTLTDCVLEVEAPGISKAKEIPCSDVKPKGTFMATVPLKPWKVGKKHLVAVFNSKQLEDVNGEHAINVKPKAKGRPGQKAM